MSTTAQATAFKIDSAHTDIEFSVRHMGISTVRGRFTEFEGSVEVEHGQPVAAMAKIKAASVHTKQEDRDKHLRSEDFFDVAHHPEIRFASRSFTHKGERTFQMTGELTMRGVTKNVTLEVEVSESIKDPYGNDRIGFSAEGKVDRREWGLNWGQVMEAGGLVVGHDVKIHIAGEATA